MPARAGIAKAVSLFHVRRLERAGAGGCATPPAAPAPGRRGRARARAPSPAAVAAADKILTASASSRRSVVVPGMMAELEPNVTTTRPEIKDMLRATLKAIQPDSTDREADVRQGDDAARLADVREGDHRRRGLLREPRGQEISRGHPGLSSEAFGRHRRLAREAVDRHPRARARGDEEEGLDF